MSTQPPGAVRVRTRPNATPNSGLSEQAVSSAENLNGGAIRGALGLKVEYRAPESLQPSPRNARTHSKKQLAKIEASVRQFGFVNPILIDAAGEIIAGHGRYAAAVTIGLKQIPTICLDRMSEADRRAYRIADNRLAELSGWDDELLKIELSFLSEIDIDLPEITGFETAEIDLILEPGGAPVLKPDPADLLPHIDMAEPAVSCVGDAWELGEHRLLNGDAKEAVSYARLLGGESAQMVFADVPYNSKVSNICRTGRHENFVEASGEMSREEYLVFLKTVLGRMAEASRDGAIHFVCIDWRNLHTLLEAGQSVYDELKNIICWAKTNGGMGSLYRSQSEFIPCFKKGTAPHINNVQLGKYGRFRTNVWSYAGANTFKRGRETELAWHPTVKPVALVKDAIKDCSKPGGIILDAFGGSGTTLIAAAQTKRRGFLIELEPKYVDIAVRRWEVMFGAEARHAENGMTFAEVKRQRQS
jgi:DNA modification methylase